MTSGCPRGAGPPLPAQHGGMAFGAFRPEESPLPIGVLVARRLVMEGRHRGLRGVLAHRAARGAAAGEGSPTV